MDFSLRPVTVGDVDDLRQLYRESVATLGPAAYSAAQVAAWQAFAAQPGFADFVLTPGTWLAHHDGTLAGFCGVEADGHVTALYLAPGYCGRGLGETLLRAVLARHPAPASGGYHAEASAFSLPVFLRCGFVHAGVEHVVRDGVAFARILVSRPAP